MEDHSAVNMLTVALVLSVLAAAASTSAQPASGAWERWGITKPAPDAAEPRLIAACNLLYAPKFDSARQAYADLVRDYPTSAEAHLGLSLAFRHLGQLDTALAEVKTALSLDPDGVGPLCQYANMLVGWQRGAPASGEPADSARFAPAIQAARKAAASGHRYSTYAHVMLWAHHTSAGRLDEARQEMKSLGARGYYPPFLLDFGRNMMAGLPPDAILFTGGDTDTEPRLCLQASEGFRPDVTVVKLSFLWYPKATTAMRDLLRLPLSLSNAELDEIWSRPDSVAEKPESRYARTLDNVIMNAQEQNRPVYFASTVDRGLMGEWKEHLVKEGMSMRVVPAKTGDSVDIQRVLENVRSWRMGTAGQKVNWTACMAPTVRQTSWHSLHYIMVYLDLARYFQQQGEPAKVDEWCRRAYGLIEHLDDPPRAGQLVKAWLDMNPNSAEAKELSKHYK